MVKEKWKQIEGYENRYFVSNLGRVKNVSNKLLKITINNSGYQHTRLFNGKSWKWYYIHRLVAQAFIPNMTNKPDINHKDGNKLNNKSCNLEWVTKSENHIHLSYILRKGLCIPKPVKCIETGTIYSSIAEATKEIGLKSCSCINQAALKRRKTAGGYHWCYINKECL